jgi:FxsC-like protein
MADTSFFLSYASDDDKRDKEGESSLVRSFFEELRAEVRDKAGGSPPMADGSFIDVALPLGARWEQDLKKAACEAALFVPLMSATYFQSEWCGREWAIFEQRVTTLGGSATRFLPLIWIPTDEPWPQYAAWYQHTLDDKNNAALRDAMDVYRERGLKWLVRFRNQEKYSVQYATVVSEIASWMVRTAKTSTLPPLPLERARTIPARFGPTVMAAAAAVDGADDASVNSAQFAALVARRNAVSNTSLRERYGGDRWDWMPFHPENQQRLYEILVDLARAAGLRPTWFEQDAGVFEQIRALEARGQIVLVIVDPWSTEQHVLAGELQKLDQALFRNCSIIVIWSDDPAKEPQLARLVRKELLGRRMMASQVDEVQDLAALASSLKAAFKRLNEQLAMVRPLARSLPEGTRESLPIISATRDVP